MDAVRGVSRILGGSILVLFGINEFYHILDVGVLGQLVSSGIGLVVITAPRIGALLRSMRDG